MARNKTRSTHQEKTALESSIIIKRAGKRINTQDNAIKTFKVDSFVEAYSYLFTALHLRHIGPVEIMVFNPTPSQPTTGCLFPPDMYLIDEGRLLEILRRETFITHCENLVRKRNVQNIGGIVGLNREDTWRLSVFVSHNQAQKDKGIEVSFVVSGESQERNHEKLHQLLECIGVQNKQGKT